MIKYKYLPYNKNLKDRARKMRNEMTTAEKKLWFGHLRQDNHRWLRQKPIGNFIVDFYCSELKLIIEVDGGTHLENKDVFNDKERSKKLEKLGLKILRFWNDDIINGLNEVVNIIEEEIKKIKSPPTPFIRGGGGVKEYMNKLFLYNTLSRKKEEFKPIEKGRVGLYTCGPTVYNYAHLGNLRTYLFEDILKRVLLYNGYKVKHVMNITDVGHLTGDRDMGEDKLEIGAKRERKTAWEIAEFYTQAFRGDIKKLNILEPDIWCKATDYIREQIELIKILEVKGYIYKTSDGLYYDTAKFKDYTKLSRQNLEALKEGARVEKNEEKKNATDFALWKFSTPHPNPLLLKEREIKKKRQMEWASPWGVGFPGWHIECSAMSLALLKNQRDIHCGGVDHINVHHTNEIAQSEAATGQKFFNFWLHGAFLNIAGGKKMAKSAENFLTLENALVKKRIQPLAYRFMALGTHYRKPMEYSEEAILNAEKGLEHLYNQISGLGSYDDRGVFVIISGLRYINIDFKGKFLEAINDDLNLPQALAIVQEVLKSDLPKNYKLATVLDFDKVLGLGLEEVLRLSVSVSPSSPPEEDWDDRNKQIIKKFSPEVVDLIKRREKARQERNFEESDRLRKEIKKKGYIVEDIKEGQKIIKK